MASENFLRVIPSVSDPWVAVVNGKKYVYPAGTEQYVPAEVAVLIDAQERHEQPKYPPAQGGGGGDMLVTITAVMPASAEAEPQYVADKTFAEISEAIESGKNVRAMINNNGAGHFFSLVVFAPNTVVMFSLIAPNAMGVIVMGLEIYPDENVTTLEKMI